MLSVLSPCTFSTTIFGIHPLVHTRCIPSTALQLLPYSSCTYVQSQARQLLTACSRLCMAVAARTHRVRLANLIEFVLRLGAVIHIRVVLSRELPERRLKFRFRAAPVHSEHIVEVSPHPHRAGWSGSRSRGGPSHG